MYEEAHVNMKRRPVLLAMPVSLVDAERTVRWVGASPYCAQQ